MMHTILVLKSVLSPSMYTNHVSITHGYIDYYSSPNILLVAWLYSNSSRLYRNGLSLSLIHASRLYPQFNYKFHLSFKINMITSWYYDLIYISPRNISQPTTIAGRTYIYLDGLGPVWMIYNNIERILRGVPPNTTTAPLMFDLSLIY